MGHEKLIAILEEIGTCAQNMLISSPPQKHRDTVKVFIPLWNGIHKKCLEQNLSVCLFKKVVYRKAGATASLAVTTPLLNGWPSEDPTTIHAHVTVCLEMSEKIGSELGPGVMYHGEVVVEFVNLQASGVIETMLHQPEESRTPKKPNEGGLVSSEETERLLKAFGIENI